MAWWYAVVEARHELQNPTSAEKIIELGRRLGLGPSSRLLDMGSGRGGPALLLAGECGCRITCVERAPEFADAARKRITAAGMSELIDVVEADGATYEVEPASFDAAVCLGASFIYGGLRETIEALKPAVPARGLLAVGEPYWRVWPLPDGFEPDKGDEDFLPLSGTVERAEETGVDVVGLIASSEDDWDRYESLHWSTLAEWLAENPTDPDADEFRALVQRRRERYLTWERDLLGWAIFALRT